MKKQTLFLVLLTFCFLLPTEAFAKKRRRVFKRKLSISFVNGYTYAQSQKSNNKVVGEEWADDGQMQPFFSAVEISRNSGFYELGARIQNLGPTFVSPFFKWNIIKNNSKSSIIPSLTVGVVPSNLLGAWLRAGLDLSINRYVSIAPFLGVYGWYKVKGYDYEGAPTYEKYNLHLNVGLRLSCYL